MGGVVLRPGRRLGLLVLVDQGGAAGGFVRRRGDAAPGLRCRRPADRFAADPHGTPPPGRDMGPPVRARRAVLQRAVHTVLLRRDPHLGRARRPHQRPHPSHHRRRDDHGVPGAETQPAHDRRARRRPRRGAGRARGVERDGRGAAGRRRRLPRRRHLLRGRLPVLGAVHHRARGGGTTDRAGHGTGVLRRRSAPAVRAGHRPRRRAPAVHVVRRAGRSRHARHGDRLRLELRRDQSGPAGGRQQRHLPGARLRGHRRGGLPRRGGPLVRARRSRVDPDRRGHYATTGSDGRPVRRQRCRPVRQPAGEATMSNSLPSGSASVVHW